MWPESCSDATASQSFVIWIRDARLDQNGGAGAASYRRIAHPTHLRQVDAILVLAKEAGRSNLYDDHVFLHSIALYSEQEVD